MQGHVLGCNLAGAKSPVNTDDASSTFAGEIQCDLHVGCMVFGYDRHELFVFLERQRNGKWSLPIAPMEVDQTAEKTARLMLSQRFIGHNVVFEQMNCFTLKRHQQQVMVIAFVSLVNTDSYAGADHSRRWWGVKKLPIISRQEVLAIETGRSILRQKLGHYPVSYKLLPQKFTLPELHKIYELVFDCHLDRRNFEKKIFNLNILRQLKEKRGIKGKKPAQMYSFRYPSEMLRRRHLTGRKTIFKAIERRVVVNENTFPRSPKYLPA